MFSPNTVIIIIAVAGLSVVFFFKRPLLKMLVVSAISIIGIIRMYLLNGLSLQLKEFEQFLQVPSEINYETAVMYLNNLNSLLNQISEYQQSYDFVFYTLIIFLILTPILFSLLPSMKSTSKSH